MKKIMITFCCFISALGAMEQLPDGISINRVQEKDILRVMALSNEIMDEFFRPLMLAEYPGNPFANNPELFNIFFDKINSGWVKHLESVTSGAENNNAHVLIASDNEDPDKIVGFCAFAKKEDLIYIYQMMVSQSARNKGIAKALFKTALSMYTDIVSCQFKTFAYGNELMHKLCEHYGVINKGITKLAIMPEGTPATHFMYQLDIKK